MKRQGMTRFFRFAIVGALGFGVDVAILYAVVRLGAGWVPGRLWSWLGAASVTWIANRRFTFAMATPPTVREWVTFLAANSLGGVVNYATYVVALIALPLVAAHPFLGVGAGSVAGLIVNFGLSSKIVFASGGTR
jgi:putative flippase GtrA